MLSATPPFLYLIILGTVMILTTVFLLSPDPTKGLCISWIWLLSLGLLVVIVVVVGVVWFHHFGSFSYTPFSFSFLGFTLSFGSLLIKNYRVAKILGGTRQFFRKKIELNQLFAMLFVVFLIDVVFLVLFTVIDTPSVRHNECKYEGLYFILFSFSPIFFCFHFIYFFLLILTEFFLSDAAQIMIIIILVEKAVLVAPALWISWKTKSIANSNFNEVLF